MSVLPLHYKMHPLILSDKIQKTLLINIQMCLVPVEKDSQIQEWSGKFWQKEKESFKGLQ